MADRLGSLADMSRLRVRRAAGYMSEIDYIHRLHSGGVGALSAATTDSLITARGSSKGIS